MAYGEQKIERCVGWPGSCLDGFQGILYAVFRKYNSKEFTLFSSDDNGASWEEVSTTTVMTALNDVNNPSLCIDANGLCHLPFQYHVYDGGWRDRWCYINYDLDTDTWGSLEYPSTTNQRGSQVGAILDSTGNLHCLCMAGYGSYRYIRRDNGGGWYAEATLSTPDYSNKYRNPTVLSNGNIVVVYPRDDYDKIIQHLYTTGWATSDAYAGSAVDRDTGQQCLGLNDTVHHLFNEPDTTVKYHQRSGAGVWSTPVTVVSTTELGGGSYISPVAISVDDDGVIHALLHVHAIHTSNGSLGLKTSSDGGATWSSIAWVMTADASRYYQGFNNQGAIERPVAGAAWVVHLKEGDGSDDAYFFCTDDFEFVTVYSEWTKRVTSGEALANYTV